MRAKEKHTKHEVLESWVIEYSDELYTWACYKVSSNETAEDLVQETFLSATKSFSQHEIINSPKTWLFKILNNKIIDYYRKSSTKLDKVSSHEFICTSTVENLFDSNGQWKDDNSQLISIYNEVKLLDDPDFIDVWGNCLDNLPKKWRFVIESKYIFKKKGTEICNELQITSSNYWQIVHRAKLLLKGCIGRHWDL